MKKFLLVVLAVIVSYASDGTSSNTLESLEDKVIINNVPLSYNISIDGSNSRFISDLLDARVIITNKDSNQHDIEYKFVWYDVGGFEMGKHLSKWRQVRVDAKDTIILKKMAVTPKIDSFKFYVRGIEH